MRSIRGNKIAMIFQEPMTSLTPAYTIGEQIMEAITLHQQVDKREARERAIQMLERVGMPQPSRTIDSYPHQFSGGMLQRAMIAIGLSCNPSLLIADEPTTALDVTTEAQILELMRDIQQEMGMAIMYITHDLGVIAEMAERWLRGQTSRRCSTIRSTLIRALCSSPFPGSIKSRWAGWRSSEEWCQTPMPCQTGVPFTPDVAALCPAPAIARHPNW
jgi:ABC-type microcin C transport system duplicated ATPase subunit YejF